MDRQQQMVREFMVALDQPTPEKPTELSLKRMELRLSLILEEFDELFHACPFGEDIDDPTWLHLQRADGTSLRIPQFDRTPKLDRVEQIDALIDILYVTYGMATEMGVDLEPFFDEVHASNMRKVGGPIDERGKRLKPPGWTPPDIEGVYRRLYGDL